MALKWGIVPLMLVLSTLGVRSGGVESNVDNVGHRDNHDNIQDEILAAMKDSGVLDEWKEKLDDMLYNDIDDSKPTEKAKKLPVINNQEKEMLRSFIDEYKTDANSDVSTDLILNIVERVQKTPKPNLPQIFVQLGPVIDIISSISKHTKDLQKIIDRQAPIFDSPAKPKDILHTLSENLKSELVRLRPQSQPKPQKKPQAQGAQGLGLSDYLTLGSTLLKGGNGAQIMSLLSGETDVSSMIQLLPKLIEGGEYKSILSKMINSYLSSSPVGSMVSMYLGNVLDSEDGEKFMNSAYAILEEFVKSKSYERLSTIVPKVMTAKNSEEILNILTKEVENNWDLFFASIKNEDYKENFLDKFASYVVQGYDFYQNIPSNSIMGQASLMVNGLLVANKLPGYNSRKPVESLTKIAVKAWKLYSPVKDVDIAPHIETVIQALSQAYQAQSHGNSFSKLNSKEKQSLISRLIDAELISPIQAVWSVYSKSQSAPQCSSHLLCLVNMREAKTNAGPARQSVVKGASLVASWALSQGSKDKYWSLYKAVWSGGKGDDCSVQFPVEGKTCDVFTWQKKQMMNTQYDHVEL